MILLGYDSTNGYKLYDAANKWIVISQYFIFDETKEVQQSAIGCTKSETGYTSEKSVSVVLKSLEPAIVKPQFEANVRRSTR